jgi:hypothetical protein
MGSVHRRIMTDDKATPNTEEPQELQADQLEEVDGGLTHPSLPNYYPIAESNPLDGKTDQNSVGSIPKAG